MIGTARERLGDRAGYVVADACALPFADGSFDVVVANHMLYHVPDRPSALAEIRRVLARGGVLHASTNGRGHLAELQALVPDWKFGAHVEAFGLETGPPQLEQFFADLRLQRFDDRLEVTEVGPVLAYIRSSSSYQGAGPDAACRTVRDAIQLHGFFLISKASGLISCRKR
jgi:SAM-dependent methyltransferase